MLLERCSVAIVDYDISLAFQVGIIRNYITAVIILKWQNKAEHIFYFILYSTVYLEDSLNHMTF